MDSTAAVFIAAATICFAVVVFGLTRGLTLGIAFRSRLIARRKLEPGLFWVSVAIFAAFGAFLTYAVIAVELSDH